MNKFILGAIFFLSQRNEAALHKNIISLMTPQKINIAIIDTGVDIKHKDLAESIWTNEGEIGKDAHGRDKSTNGIDDDGNGFIDDIHGWNFIDNNNDVFDEIGHGTHIAGIIKDEFQRHHTKSTLPAAARFMILKYYSPNSKDDENILNSTKAIRYANRMNAKIINYSGGGARSQGSEFLAIQESQKKKIIFVAAAGNNNSDTDYLKYYPANYPLSNIISVAATNRQGELVSFSNYGQTSIDIAAPGKKILSTLPKNRYGFMSGTSQATAFVTGQIAALLANQSTDLTAQKVLAELTQLGQKNPTLKGKTKTQVALVDSD